MKIETIESAITAIESSGFIVKPAPQDIIDMNDSFCGFIHNLMNDAAFLVQNQDELIEFARRCNLKAFW